MEFVKTGEKEDMVRLSDGKNSAWFDFMEMAVVDGDEYVALIQQGDTEPVILRLCEEAADGKERYFTVDDDALFERVLSVLEANMEDDE